MILTLLFLTAFACSGPQAEVAMVSPPLEKCPISTEPSAAADHFIFDLAPIFSEYCPNGSPHIRFELEDEAFVGDRVLITCMNGTKNNRETCQTQILPAVNYQFLVKREPRQLPTRIGVYKRRSPTLAFVDLNVSNKGLPACRGDTYVVAIAHNKTTAIAMCEFFEPLDSTLPLGSLIRSFVEGSYAFNFRYETPPGQGGVRCLFSITLKVLQLPLNMLEKHAALNQLL